MHRVFGIILTLTALIGCGGGEKNSAIQLGVDPNWYPINFGNQTTYINGFVEELLLEAATRSKTDYIRQAANAESLLTDLQSGKYDAILTSLPPYNFNLAKYDFSQNFLDLGPVLIVPVDAHVTELSQLSGELVGTVTNDPAVMVLQTFPDIIMRNYPSIPELLNAIVAGELEGALLNRIPASNFIRDLYSGQLKIVGDPLTNAGLHMVTLKGEHQKIIKQFDKTLDSMKKKKMSALLKKWELD